MLLCIWVYPCRKCILCIPYLTSLIVQYIVHYKVLFAHIQHLILGDGHLLYNFFLSKDYIYCYYS